MKLRNVIVGARRTSMRLEQPYWDALLAICARRGTSVHALCTELDRDRAGSLSSAVRVFVLEHAAEAAGRASGDADASLPAGGPLVGR